MNASIPPMRRHADSSSGGGSRATMTAASPSPWSPPVPWTTPEDGSAGRGHAFPGTRSPYRSSFIVTIPESVATDDAVNGWMSMIAGLATLDAIEGTLDECGAVPFDPECGFHLKWPNDIYCHGLKLGSTFTQVASPPDRHGDVAVIFSVGVNLSVPADRLPTPESTSLRMHVAPLPPTAELIDMIAARLVASLRTRLEAFVQMPLIQSSRLRSEMHHVCWMMGRQIDAQLIDGRTIAGKVVSLNDDASISVRTASGETERLSTGDIGLMV